MVEKLCDELLNKDDLKLSEEKLQSVFEQIGLEELLNNRSKEYLKQLDEVLYLCQ